MDKEKLKQELIKFAEWQENTILPDTNEEMANDYLKQYVALPQADVSGSLPCHHNYIQKDTYWKSCTHCGMLIPLGQ